METVNMGREEAQQQIAAILAAVEKETGQIVRAVEIEEVDVTNVNSTARTQLRFVNINLFPRWAYNV